MSSIRFLKQTFSGGEISAEMFGRLEDAGYQNGLALCRNFMVRPQGSLENRTGFEFIRPAKYADKKARLIPFAYSDTQTLIVEFGEHYCRFHSFGGTVLNGDQPYEIETPYGEGDLFGIHYVQSADVMTLVHPNHPPLELRRYGHTDWRLAEISFKPSIRPPQGLSIRTVVADGKGATDSFYVITAVARDGVTESEISAAVAVSNNLYTTGNKNILSWQKVDGASRYKVYKKAAGMYGYIGQTMGTELVDDNISADLSVTPPIYEDPFAANGISEVEVVDGGSGYADKGAIESVAVTSGGGPSPSYGMGYPNGRHRTGQRINAFGRAYEFAVADQSGSGAVLEITVSNNSITGITVINGGRDYTNPRLQMLAVYSVMIKTGHFNKTPEERTVGVSFDTLPNGRDDADGVRRNAGREAVLEFGISGRPKPEIEDATGYGAVLSPVIENGRLKSITVVSPGRAYTDPKIKVGNAKIGRVKLGSSNYPSAVSYHQQRRVFAGTTDKPLHVWMTRSGTENNMSYSVPGRADDRILFRIAAREAGRILHIVPLAKPVLLTSGAEWNIGTLNSDVLTPDSISVSPQSYIGASNVQPVVVNNSLIYAASRGGHIRELAYNWQAGGYVTGDLSLRCPHLFDWREVRDLALGKSPYPVIWAVSDNGTLLGCTYIPEQQIGAWHRHDTDGAFESCACVAEGADDVLYCVVRRNINNQDVRYIERMRSRRFTSLDDAFFVDCGLSYNGEATDTLKGLQHLEGKTVSILADGAVMPPQVVKDGTVNLPVEAMKVHVGLPIGADAQTLPLTAAVDHAYGQGRMKNINKIWLRVYRTSGIFAGQSDTELVEYKQRRTEPPGSPPQTKSEQIEIVLRAQWNADAQIFVRQIHPLPLTLLSMAAEVAIS